MPMNPLPPKIPPTIASNTDAREALVPVRARMLGNQIVGLVDQDGNDLGMPVTAIKSSGEIGKFSVDTEMSAVPRVVRFPDFSPCVLGSLVAGATYGQSGNTVTVTATGHGLPTTRNGYRIFWPGSAAVPAGWYGDLNVFDANTFSFTNPTIQTVSAGSAVTGQLPYLGAVTVASLVIQAGLISAYGALRLTAARGGDTNAANKLTRFFLNSSVIADHSSTTTPSGVAQWTISRVGRIGTVGGRSPDGVFYPSQNYTLTSASADWDSSDVTLQVRQNLHAASGWVAIDFLFLEVYP